jgi:hypothetical protein
MSSQGFAPKMQVMHLFPGSPSHSQGTWKLISPAQMTQSAQGPTGSWSAHDLNTVFSNLDIAFLSSWGGGQLSPPPINSEGLLPDAVTAFAIDIVQALHCSEVLLRWVVGTCDVSAHESPPYYVNSTGGKPPSHLGGRLATNNTKHVVSVRNQVHPKGSASLNF